MTINNKIHDVPIIAVDVDGTLCNEICWTILDCKNATPKIDVINKINELYQSSFIVIHTARRNDLYEITIEWLEKNNVKYHAVKFEKMPADMYIDDKARTLEDLLKE